VFTVLLGVLLIAALILGVLSDSPALSLTCGVFAVLGGAALWLMDWEGER
jgi:hypothetical protein